MRPRKLSVFVVVATGLAMPALSQSNACLDTKDYVKAVIACSEAVRAHPADPRAYHMRGTVLAKNGDVGQAIADYTKAIQINAGYVPAYNSRALAYTSMGDYTRALADATMASELEAGKGRQEPQIRKKPTGKAQGAARPKAKTSSWDSGKAKEKEKPFNPFEGM